MAIGRGIGNDADELVYTDDNNRNGWHYDKCLSEWPAVLQI